MDEWRALAGCAGTDLDAFFTPDPVEGYRVALKVCRRCAVRADCLDAAMVEEADESRRCVQQIEADSPEQETSTGESDPLETAKIIACALSSGDHPRYGVRGGLLASQRAGIAQRSA